MIEIGLLVLFVIRQTGVVFGHPALHEGAVLDLAQDVLHPRLGVGVDHPRTADEVAVLRGFRHEFEHAGDAAFVEQIDDQLQFVQDFVVGDFRLVTGFHQGLEARLHQRAGAAAQHRLFAEQIGFGFFLEGGLDEVRARAAQACGVEFREFLGAAAAVLVHRVDAGHTAADLVFATHQRARALGRDQHHIQIGARRDHPEMHVQAVREQQAGALFQIRGQYVVVELLLHHVRGQHRDQIRACRCFRGRFHGEAVGERLDFGRAARAQADDDIEAGIAEIERVRAALAAVTDDCDGGVGRGVHDWFP